MILQDGGLSVANLLPVSGLVTCDILESLRILACQISTKLSQSTAWMVLLPVSENKRTPYLNSISGFDIDHFNVIDIGHRYLFKIRLFNIDAVSGAGLPHFIEIG